MNIYKITNKQNGLVYVGQTKLNIYERWGRHILDSYRADRGVADKQKSKFHSAIVEYTPDSFVIELLEECEKDKADEREIYWQHKLNTVNKGYNMVYCRPCFGKGKNHPAFKTGLTGKGDLDIDEIMKEVAYYEQKNQDEWFY